MDTTTLSNAEVEEMDASLAGMWDMDMTDEDWFDVDLWHASL